MAKGKRLSKKQLSVIEDLFVGQLDEQAILDKHKVSRAVFVKWQMERRFVEEFNRRIAANKVPGIRCIVAWDVRSARLGREHNDANVLSIGERMMSIQNAIEIVDVWLKTPFEGGRHKQRINKIEKR